jgi:carbon monoxide dehydrogenase subunit G
VSRARVTVEVRAPAQDVWNVIADPRNLLRWDRHISKVEGVPSSGLTKGSKYSTRVRFMGVSARLDAEVLDIDPPRYAKVRLRGLMDATVETTVTSLGNVRSRIEHVVDYDFRGGPLGKLAAKGLKMTGGPHLVLRRGTMAQKRQAEEH